MRVAMLLHKSVEHDSRVRREARALAAAGHEVTVLHMPARQGELDGPLDGFEVESVTPSAWVRRLLPAVVYRLCFFVAFVRAARRLRPDVVHAHDVAMLAPGWLAARLARARLVYDSHEYAAGVPYRERTWALFVAALERFAVARCAAVITVSDGIADRLRERYRLARRPVVVRNVPEPPATRRAEGRSPGLRARLGLDGAPLVLHQGGLAPGRGCEQLVLAVRQLPDAHLVFLGDAWPGYEGSIERLAAAEGVAARVHFLPSVPIADLAACTAEATVGVSLLADSCDNHRLALPNKVFEYIAAGVPVVASDLPELRALIERHGVGRLADPADPAAVACALSEAIADRDRLAAAATAARRQLTWEVESERLIDLYRELGTAPPRARRLRARRRGAGRALVFVRNAVTHDARVQREARLLADLGLDPLIVGVVAHDEPPGDGRLGDLPVRRLTPGAPLWPLRAHRALMAADWYRQAIAELLRERPALVHCNDHNTMWIGVAAKLVCRARVVYDTHELWPDRNLRREWRPWLIAAEALFVRVADRVTTTSPGYARVIASRYRTAPPLVVRNVPEASAPAEPAPLGAPRRPSATRLAVYFGAVTRGRGLERSIAALRRHDDLALRIVGPEAWGFRDQLDALARELGVRDRVELLDPVPPGERDAVLADADVGLLLIEPVCLSYRLTLPNKLFEYMVAGLPAVATDLPEIAAALSATGAGVTVDCDDDGSLDRGLRAALDPECNAALRTAARAAAAGLSWSLERELLAAVYRDLAPGPQVRR